MLKRILGVIMSVFMLVCFCVPAQAANINEPEQPFSWEAYEFVGECLQNTGRIQIADDGTLEILPFPEDAFNPVIVDAIRSYVNEFLNPLVLQGMIRIGSNFEVTVTQTYVDYANAMIQEQRLNEFGFDFYAGIGETPNTLLIKNYADDAGETKIEFHWLYYLIYLSNDATNSLGNKALITAIICTFLPRPVGGAIVAILLLYVNFIQSYNTNGRGVVIRMHYPPLPGFLSAIWAQ